MFLLPFAGCYPCSLHNSTVRQSYVIRMVHGDTHTDNTVPQRRPECVRKKMFTDMKHKSDTNKNMAVRNRNIVCHN